MNKELIARHLNPQALLFAFCNLTNAGIYHNYEQFVFNAYQPEELAVAYVELSKNKLLNMKTTVKLESYTWQHLDYLANGFVELNKNGLLTDEAMDVLTTFGENDSCSFAKFLVRVKDAMKSFSPEQQNLMFQSFCIKLKNDEKSTNQFNQDSNAFVQSLHAKLFPIQKQKSAPVRPSLIDSSFFPPAITDSAYSSSEIRLRV